MDKILVLWATPRSTSTAFEWMMRQRGDFTVFHEPFGEPYFYGEDRRSTRTLDREIKPGLTFDRVWSEVRAAAADGPVFMKEFATYVVHRADDDFLSHFRHSFLVRDPVKVLPSIHAHWGDFTLDEAGFEDLSRLFERVTALEGRPPPVIDSDDLLERPSAVVEAYCDAIGIPFMPEALEWEPGARKEVSWYDSGSWHGNLRESRGLQKQQRDYADINANEHLQGAYKVCRHHYEALYAHRLAAV